MERSSCREFEEILTQLYSMQCDSAMMQPSFLSHLCQESCGNWDLMTLLWFDLSAGPRPFFEQESRLWCIQLALKPDVQHKITSNRLRPYSIGFCFIGLTTNSPISRSTWKGQAAGNSKKYWPSCTACSVIRRWCNHHFSAIFAKKVVETGI